MRTIIGLLIVTALVVAGAWYLQHLVGSIALQVGSIVVQAPLSVAVLAVLAFVGTLYLLFRVTSLLLGFGKSFRIRSERTLRRRGDEAVTNVLLALAAREGADAKREAAKARRLLGDTPQTLLLAAYAGSVAGDEASATDAFEKLSTRKDAAFLGLRGLLGQAVAREDWSRANELAKQAARAHPGASWIRAERTNLAMRTGDWQEALLLSRDGAPHAALAAAAADAETDPGKAHRLAKDAFKRDPSLTAAALAYARRLREGGREKSAQDVLRNAWSRAPHPEIAAMALAPAVDRTARLKAAQALVRDVPENVESHLLLGRVSLQAGLIDDALNHAEAAERNGMRQRRIYMLLADIADAGGQDAAHQDAHREALRRASTAEPDPAWVCEACGITHPAWSPACPNCHAAGTVRWGQPQSTVSAFLAS
jgi:HemY protein